MGRRVVGPAEPSDGPGAQLRFSEFPNEYEIVGPEELRQGGSPAKEPDAQGKLLVPDDTVDATGKPVSGKSGQLSIEPWPDQSLAESLVQQGEQFDLATGSRDNPLACYRSAIEVGLDPSLAGRTRFVIELRGDRDFYHAALALVDETKAFLSLIKLQEVDPLTQEEKPNFRLPSIYKM